MIAAAVGQQRRARRAVATRRSRSMRVTRSPREGAFGIARHAFAKVGDQRPAAGSRHAEPACRRRRGRGPPGRRRPTNAPARLRAHEIRRGWRRSRSDIAGAHRARPAPGTSQARPAQDRTQGRFIRRRYWRRSARSCASIRAPETAKSGGVSSRSAEHHLEARRIVDVFVDFHPQHRLVLPLQQAAGDAGAFLDTGEHRGNRSARSGRVRRVDPVVDVAMDRRSSVMRCGRAARRGRAPRTARAEQPQRRSVGSAPRCTSPLAVAASCSTASRSLPPSGAAAALTIVPHACSPNAALYSRAPGDRRGAHRDARARGALSAGPDTASGRRSPGRRSSPSEN